MCVRNIAIAADHSIIPASLIQRELVRGTMDRKFFADLVESVQQHNEFIAGPRKPARVDAGQKGFSPSSPATCSRHRAAQRVWESHTLFFELAQCECTCEWWGNLRIREDTRPPPNRRPFPPPPHRINV